MQYGKLIQQQIHRVYQTGIASKILQHMDLIRNVSDLSQSRRWVMELLQNARDTAYEGSNVCVRIERTPDAVRFLHNGRPFRVKDILSIINQVSSKQAEENAVGRFGTGFMTTYQLSEVVEITSVLRDQDPESGALLPYKPFSITLDRSGRNNDEIFSAILDCMSQLNQTDTQEELLHFDPTEYHTCFTYHLSTEESRLCAQTGTTDLLDNILYILLCSEQLAQIELVTEDETRLYCRGSVKAISEHLHSLYIHESCNGIESVHELLYLMQDGLTLAACLDETGRLLPIHPNTPRIFVDFPLIGAEQFPFPVVINHREFQPNEPRSGISLVDNQGSADARRNKAIIDQAVTYYRIFLEEIAVKGYDGIENILAIPDFQPNREISESWIKEHVYGCLYEIIAEIPFFSTDSGKTSLVSPSLYLTDGETLETRERLRELLSPLRNYCVPLGKTHWAKALSGYPIPEQKVITMEKLLPRASEILRNELEESSCSAITWCSNLYAAAMEVPELAVKIQSGQVRIFPNQDETDWKERRLFAIHELKRDVGIPNILKDVSELLDQLTSNSVELPIHLRKELLSLDFVPQLVPQMGTYELAKLYNFISRRSNRRFPVVNFSWYQSKYLKLWKDAWLLMLSCGMDTTLYELYAKLPNQTLPSRTELGIECEPSVWRNSLSGVTNLLVDFIESCRNLETLQNCLQYKDSDQTMEWLNSVLSYAVQYVDSLFSRRIFPNQKGTFLTCSHMSIGSGYCLPMQDNTNGEELKTIADLFSDLDESCAFFEYTFDRRLTTSQLHCDSLTDELVASKITNIITQLMQQKSLSEASENHQKACSMLMVWLHKYAEKVTRLFPAFQTPEDRMKLLTPGEAVRLEKKATELENLMEEIGCESVEELHNQMKEWKQSKAEPSVTVEYSEKWDCWLGDELNGLTNEEREAFFREIGTAGERIVFKAVRESLLKQGCTLCLETDATIQMEDTKRMIQVNYPDHDQYHQTGWDICVDIKEKETGAKECYFVEVKTHTTTSIYKDQIRLSRNQMAQAMAHGQNYIVAKVAYCREEEDCSYITWYSDVARCIGMGKLSCLSDTYWFQCKEATEIKGEFM